MSTRIYLSSNIINDFLQFIIFPVSRESVILTKWTKLKKKVGLRGKKLLELTKLVGVFRDIEDVKGELQKLEVTLLVSENYFQFFFILFMFLTTKVQIKVVCSETFMRL